MEVKTPCNRCGADATYYSGIRILHCPKCSLYKETQMQFSNDEDDPPDMGVPAKVPVG